MQYFDSNSQYYYGSNNSKTVGNLQTTIKILAIDDDQDILSLLSLQMKQVGWCVQTALNGQIGLELFCQDEFDLIITDAMMPQMSGYEVITAIRNNPKGANIPIIMLSAITNEEEIARAMGQGVDAYFGKPYNKKLLQNQILELLDRAHSF
jgi:DNA-binding response OmpR family regulator